VGTLVGDAVTVAGGIATIAQNAVLAEELDAIAVLATIGVITADNIDRITDDNIERIIDVIDQVFETGGIQ
jgi:hypothetical protein